MAFRLRGRGAGRRPGDPLPRRAGTVRLIATADAKPPVQRDVFRLAADCRPDAVLFAGDAAYAGNSDSRRRHMLRAWRRDWGELYDILYAVAGNHDWESPRGLELWREIVPERTPSPPYAAGLGFRLRLGPVVVVGLDTSTGVIDSLQREWALRALTAGGAPQRVAVYHEPAFAHGLHRGRSLDALPDERDQLWSTLEAGGVTVVVNGHEHAYARSVVTREAAIHQVITGGAGGDLYTAPATGYDVFRPAHHITVLDIDPSIIHLRALGLSGELLDEVEIPARAASEVTP